MAHARCLVTDGNKELSTNLWMRYGEASHSLWVGKVDKPGQVEKRDALLIETSCHSPQLTLWTLGPDEWLLFKKLPDYAPRTKGRKLEILQLPLPDIDENQPPAASS